MLEFQTSYNTRKTILALGAESVGNFSIFRDGNIVYSSDFGSLSDHANFNNLTNSTSATLKKDKLRPDYLLIDLHPEFSTVEFAEKLSKKYKAKIVRVQHHVAHIFASVGEDEILRGNKAPSEFIGIACDGTGYGEDGNIWGGEVLEFRMQNAECRSVKRIGHLENQVLLGGEQAIIEPARMLISVLAKILEKDEVFGFVKKYFTRNEFELLFGQLQQGFNCFQTSSTGRILDAVAVLLGFFEKKVTHKHEAVIVLENNSTTPYALKPKIISGDINILDTTYLFAYLLKNIQKDKKRLAATAQKYLAEGLFRIAQKNKLKIYAAGGMTNNKIISDYFASKKIVLNTKLARGDGTLSFGQMVYGLKQGLK